MDGKHLINPGAIPMYPLFGLSDLTAVSTSRNSNGSSKAGIYGDSRVTSLLIIDTSLSFKSDSKCRLNASFEGTDLAGLGLKFTVPVNSLPH